jgi:hypothetical protein
MSPRTAPIRAILNVAFIGENEMTTNLGTMDRVFRLLLGIILLAAPFVSGLTMFTSSTATIISVIAGIVMVGTSAMKFCPLYRVFGIRTCKI